MANFIENTLEKGEKVVFQGRLHWIFNWEYLFGGVALVLISVILLIINFSLNYEDSDEYSFVFAIVCCVGIAIGLGLIGWANFIRSKTEFAITNSRFIQKDGIFNIKMTEIPLFKVETVNFYQSFLERILSTGTIELVGSGGTSHKLSYVQEPFKVRNLLTTYMKENKAKE
ncbi:MAG: PH domain-containing protein [Bacteroidaceae bacterium]|nr:PH domain-containing protein [Bacteroidaceae bacterium]